MFVMTNDGGLLDSGVDLAAEYILRQRFFIFRLLQTGMPVTILKGAEFHNSKVRVLRSVILNFNDILISLISDTILRFRISAGW